MSEQRVVLYVSPLPPPAGGIGTWTRTLVARGLPEGLRPVVVDNQHMPDREVFQHTSFASEVRRAVAVIWRFVAALRRERPVFVHVNVDPMALGFYRDALCAWLAGFAGVPAAIHYRGQVAELDEHPERRFHRWAVRATARRVPLNLVLNDASAAFLKRLAGPGVRVEKVPNYYDDRKLPPAAPAPRGPDEPLRAVFAGGLTRSKGVPELLEAAARLPDVEFHVLGKRYPETDALVDTAGANVHIHGEVDHDEVLRRMQASHVFVFPTRHREGFPNVVCEAMALGLAVVSTPKGAIAEMVEHERGGLIGEADPEVVAAALRRLGADDELRVAMGRYNADKARRLYTFDRVAERLTSLYASCSAEESSGR